jgi:hypothetical protein
VQNIDFLQDFWMKLKRHLLSRIKATQTDLDPSSSIYTGNGLPGVDVKADLDKLFFKKDRMYKHNIMRINYTTYDVRRAQDTINPNTDHRDILLLSAEDNDAPIHQYAYARVLGIYHVNVVYAGSGATGYRAQRMEFLWVRWFANIADEPVQRSWVGRQLDCLEFLPVNQENAFGFVDPASVLRGGHLMPRFAAGRQHVGGKGISVCARDSEDWCQYYVGR